MDRRGGLETQIAGRSRDIGVGLEHVAGGQGPRLDDGFLLECPLDLGQEVGEFFAPVIAEIVELVRRGAKF